MNTKAIVLETIIIIALLEYTIWILPIENFKLNCGLWPLTVFYGFRIFFPFKLRQLRDLQRSVKVHHMLGIVFLLYSVISVLNYGALFDEDLKIQHSFRDRQLYLPASYNLFASINKLLLLIHFICIYFGLKNSYRKLFQNSINRPSVGLGTTGFQSEQCKIKLYLLVFICNGLLCVVVGLLVLNNLNNNILGLIPRSERFEQTAPGFSSFGYRGNAGIFLNICFVINLYYLSLINSKFKLCKRNKEELVFSCLCLFILSVGVWATNSRLSVFVWILITTTLVKFLFENLFYKNKFLTICLMFFLIVSGSFLPGIISNRFQGNYNKILSLEEIVDINDLEVLVTVNKQWYEKTKLLEKPLFFFTKNNAKKSVLNFYVSKNGDLCYKYSQLNIEKYVEINEDSPTKISLSLNNLQPGLEIDTIVIPHQQFKPLIANLEINNQSGKQILKWYEKKSATDKIYEFVEFQLYSRIEIYTNTIKMIQDHPLFGVGLGAWYSSYLIYRQPGQAWQYWAHNDYLQLISETGIIGFGISVLIFVAYCHDKLLINKLICEKTNYLIISLIVVVGLHSCLDFPLQMNSIIVILLHIFSFISFIKSREFNTNKRI